MQPQRFVFALNSELKESIRIMKLSPILSTEVREDLTYSPEVKSRNEGHFWGYFFSVCIYWYCPNSCHHGHAQTRKKRTHNSSFHFFYELMLSYPACERGAVIQQPAALSSSPSCDCMALRSSYLSTLHHVCFMLQFYYQAIVVGRRQ